MVEDKLYAPQNSQGMNVFDVMEFHGMTEAVKLVKDVIAAKNAEIAKLQEQVVGFSDIKGLQDQVKSLQADLEQSRILIKSLDVKSIVAERDRLREQNKSLQRDLEDYKAKYRRWHNFTQDICVVFGDSTYTQVAMENWVKKMCNSDEEGRYLELVRKLGRDLFEVMPHEWNDPECGDGNPFSRLKQKD